MQDGVTKWYYYCQELAGRPPDHLNVRGPVSQFSLVILFLFFGPKTQKINIKSRILGNILTNFMWRYAKIGAKLRTKNIWSWFDMFLTFLQKDWNWKKLKTFEAQPSFLVFRQHAASIYGFFREFRQCVKKKVRPLRSKVGGWDSVCWLLSQI